MIVIIVISPSDTSLFFHPSSNDSAGTVSEAWRQDNMKKAIKIKSEIQRMGMYFA